MRDLVAKEVVRRARKTHKIPVTVLVDGEGVVVDKVLSQEAIKTIASVLNCIW